MRAVCNNNVGQTGFSLLEVLVAMLVAALGIVAVMLVHNSNLRHVRDHADLNQGQLLLNNMAYRVQQATEQGSTNASQLSEIQNIITTQAVDLGLSGFTAKVQSIQNGQLVSVQWRAHDVNDVVVRSECSQNNISIAGNHCLALWIWGGL